MKMETVGKEERLKSPKVSEQKVLAEVVDGALELEAQTENDAVPSSVDSSVLASMPCLLMELRRDSSESQLASTESDKPAAGRVDESDSSNHCMLSPSSSGHLADSDTLSSAAENEPSQVDAPVEGNTPDVPGAVVGRKSRRSRSESETSIMAAKKNRQSSEKQNGKVAKVKGHRSQKHKERIRMLRQKREAAARKKYNLLQDSSTSDSDLTCDSSTSTSDDEEVSGSTKTITSEIPDGAPVVAHYDISDTNSDPEVVNMDNLLAAAVVQENKNSVIHDTGRTWQTRGLMEELNADTGHLNAGFLMGGKSNSGTAQANDEIRIASSDSEVEIVGVQEHARCALPRAGVIQSVSSWKHGSNASYISTLQTQSWATVAPQQHWSSPSEVVDLTLDEDSRRKYLL